MTCLSFDLDRWQERLGDRRFRRAQGYAERGLVRLIAVEGRQVFALVSGEGGSVYGTRLEESGAGACSCPDFADTGACKHLGALALTADGLDPVRARGLCGRIARLRDSLAFEETAGLLEIIMGLATRIPGALEALEGEAEAGEP